MGILKYLRKETDNGKDGGRGSPCSSGTNRETDIDLRRQPTSLKMTLGNDKNTAGPVSDVNSRKKTFSVVCEGGGGSVSERVKNLETVIDKCVMGSGRCGTHNVKLSRTVKQKKYSCVNSQGQIEWKYRDVTCLVCPSQAQMTRTKAKTEIPTARGK